MRIAFNDCVLDLDARVVTRKQQEVHLAPKEFELLKFLVEHRQRAISKAELLDRLWPGVFVSEASLARVVSSLREALGDESTQIVRTVHGYGYAFAGSVHDDSRATVAAAPALCWLFCGHREFPLPNGEHIIGRDADVSVPLESAKVSRRHARVTVTGTRAVLEDLDSKNGSFVSGTRIAAATVLESGDEVRVGPFTLIFRINSGFGSTESDF